MKKQPMTKTGKKRWFTIAWLDREGNPHPAFRFENFKQVFNAERDLLDDLGRGMQRFNPHGSYVAVVWESRISPEQAMSKQRPHFQIWDNGDVNVVT
jgi:hypothetical protein